MPPRDPRPAAPPCSSARAHRTAHAARCEPVQPVIPNSLAHHRRHPATPPPGGLSNHLRIARVAVASGDAAATVVASLASFEEERRRRRLSSSPSPAQSPAPAPPSSPSPSPSTPAQQGQPRNRELIVVTPPLPPAISRIDAGEGHAWALRGRPCAARPTQTTIERARPTPPSLLPSLAPSITPTPSNNSHATNNSPLPVSSSSELPRKPPSHPSLRVSAADGSALAAVVAVGLRPTTTAAEDRGGRHTAAAAARCTRARIRGTSGRRAIGSH